MAAGCVIALPTPCCILQVGQTPMEEEANERRQAELAFIQSAYTTKEARIFPSTSESSDDDCSSPPPSSCRVHRRLVLAKDDGDGGRSIDSVDVSSGSTVLVNLVLTMPEGYLSDESVQLQVDASIVSSMAGGERVTTTADARKQAMDALPRLLAACRAEAEAHAGEESMLAVLWCADAWIENYWNVTRRDAEASTLEDVSGRQKDGAEEVENDKKRLLLGRRLIYSHHIIANSKRRAIADLAAENNLGGFVKIGWPGIIIVEGLDENCIAFEGEIRRMRWQHIEVRGEEQIEVKAVGDLDSSRVLSQTFEELDKDQMSTLASICREAGLESLFKTSMKMYEDSDDVKCVHDEGVTPAPPSLFGALVLVDHMNNAKNYRQWLRKQSKSVGCSLLLKECCISDNHRGRPTIVVGIVGPSAAVKQVLKRWRTSRVDVDSKGKPCLERMLMVIADGILESKVSASHIDRLYAHDEDVLLEQDDLGAIIHDIGGDPWFTAWDDAINRR